jgi:hypothetical protein
MLSAVGHDMNQAAAEISFHSKEENVFNVPLLRCGTRGWWQVDLPVLSRSTCL